MRKLLLILFLFIGSNVYSQTFTQTFVDRCTGEVKIVTANFINGSATVAFYNKIRTFTYVEFTNGVLNQWLIETYEWWNTLSPCSSTTATTQTAQQTAQTATAAASTASTAASTAASAASSASTTGGTTNATSNTTNGGTTTESTNTDTSNSTESSSTENSGGNGEGESGGGEETSSETSESESEGGEAESEGEKESEEGGGEKEDSDDDGDGKKSKKEKKQKMMPIQLRSDMMVNQALLGNYDIVTSIGATQSSIFGDVSYGATAMIWSNLKQFALNVSYTKVHMEELNISSLHHNGHNHYSKTSNVTTKDPKTPPIPKLKSITSASLGYMNNFGNGTLVASVMEIKPMGKWGTAGVGVNMVNMFGENKYQLTMIGYNLLYTNMIMISPRVQYAPALIWTQTPYMGKLGFTKNQFGKNDKFAPNQLSGTEIDGMIILSNSFTLQITRRFSVNVGATFIKSTNPIIPLIKSFAIGTKLPF